MSSLKSFQQHAVVHCRQRFANHAANPLVAASLRHERLPLWGTLLVQVGNDGRRQGRHIRHAVGYCKAGVVQPPERVEDTSTHNVLTRKRLHLGQGQVRLEHVLLHDLGKLRRLVLDQ
jgi:hypothetical protein